MVNCIQCFVLIIKFVDYILFCIHTQIKISSNFYEASLLFVLLNKVNMLSKTSIASNDLSLLHVG